MKTEGDDRAAMAEFLVASGFCVATGPVFPEISVFNYTGIISTLFVNGLGYVKPL
jgi:hypothetical protein